MTTKQFDEIADALLKLTITALIWAYFYVL